MNSTGYSQFYIIQFRYMVHVQCVEGFSKKNQSQQM